MKTLESLGLENHKTSNYTNYIRNQDLVCCGWMDIHEDSDNLGDNLGDSRNPIFSVEPLYWDSEAVFIFKPLKKWHKLKVEDYNNRKKIPGIKYAGEGFSFNATKYHGLVPIHIAEKLAEDSAYETTDEYKAFANSCGEKTTPKLVWKWHNPAQVFRVDIYR
jgi:hypothetical protein